MSAVNTLGGSNTPFSHETSPHWFPLTSALAAEARQLGTPYGSRSLADWGVRVVERCPAPAACRFDQKEIYLHIRWWASVKPEDVGTDDWYIRYVDIVGSFHHELGHALHSPEDWAAYIGGADRAADWADHHAEPGGRGAWAHSLGTPTVGALRRILTLLEESRVEHRHLYETVQAAGIPAARKHIIAEALKVSVYSTVLRDIRSANDAQSWTRLVELFLLITARAHGRTLAENRQNLDEINAELRQVLGLKRWDRAGVLVRSYHAIPRHMLTEPDGRPTVQVLKIVGEMAAILQQAAEEAGMTEQEQEPDEGEPGEGTGEPGEPGEGEPDEGGDTDPGEGGGDGEDSDGEDRSDTDSDGSGKGDPDDEADSEGDGKGDGKGEPDGDPDGDSDGDGSGSGDPDGDPDGDSSDGDGKGDSTDGPSGKGGGGSESGTDESTGKKNAGKSKLDELFDRLQDEAEAGGDDPSLKDTGDDDMAHDDPLAPLKRAARAGREEHERQARARRANRDALRRKGVWN